MKNIKTDQVYEFDQFYTRPEIAKQCLGLIDLNQFDTIVEPSAGTGAFFDLLPRKKSIGIELDEELCKKNLDYQHLSFFDYSPRFNSEKILVVGNPPFGTQNSLAVDFFNHAAKFASMIGFIIPKTWKKWTIQNRLASNFHLVKMVDLPPDAFVGQKITAVKCCFQIWEKRAYERTKIVKPTKHEDWEFLPWMERRGKLCPPEEADFVMLAYGSNSGILSEDLYRWRPKSVHFVKSNIGKKKLMERFSQLDFSSSENSSRQSSLGRAELVDIYTSKFGKL